MILISNFILNRSINGLQSTISILGTITLTELSVLVLLNIALIDSSMIRTLENLF